MDQSPTLRPTYPHVLQVGFPELGSSPMRLREIQVLEKHMGVHPNKASSWSLIATFQPGGFR